RNERAKGRLRKAPRAPHRRRTKARLAAHARLIRQAVTCRMVYIRPMSRFPVSVIVLGTLTIGGVGLAQVAIKSRSLLIRVASLAPALRVPRCQHYFLARAQQSLIVRQRVLDGIR